MPETKYRTTAEKHKQAGDVPVLFYLTKEENELIEKAKGLEMMPKATFLKRAGVTAAKKIVKKNAGA